MPFSLQQGVASKLSIWSALSVSVSNCWPKEVSMMFTKKLIQSEMLLGFCCRK